MRQHAQMRAGFRGLAAHVDAVDACLAAIGCQDAVQHPQASRLARAVGAEEAGDLTVASDEGDISDGFDVAESLAQILRLDHGAGPVALTKNGAGLCRSRPARAA